MSEGGRKYVFQRHNKKKIIVDEVAYKNLIVGKEYTVEGKLIDKSTAKPLKVKGKPVTASKTFTAETADGTVSLEFTFDSSGTGDKTQKEVR